MLRVILAHNSALAALGTTRQIDLVQSAGEGGYNRSDLPNTRSGWLRVCQHRGQRATLAVSHRTDGLGFRQWDGRQIFAAAGAAPAPLAHQELTDGGRGLAGG